MKRMNLSLLHLAIAVIAFMFSTLRGQILLTEKPEIIP